MMKRRNFIRVLTTGLVAAATGIKASASGWREIKGYEIVEPEFIHVSEYTDLTKSYSGLIKFTDKMAGLYEIDVPDAVFDEVIESAGRMIPAREDLEWVYLPQGMKDKSDPHGQIGYLGWRYVPPQERVFMGIKATPEWVNDHEKICNRLQLMWEAKRNS